MNAQFLQSGPTVSVGQQSPGRDWVVHNHSDLTTGMSQTKVNNTERSIQSLLIFNYDIDMI